MHQPCSRRVLLPRFGGLVVSLSVCDRGVDGIERSDQNLAVEPAAAHVDGEAVEMRDPLTAAARVDGHKPVNRDDGCAAGTGRRSCSQAQWRQLAEQNLGMGPRALTAAVDPQHKQTTHCPGRRTPAAGESRSARSVTGADVDVSSLRLRPHSRRRLVGRRRHGASDLGLRAVEFAPPSSLRSSPDRPGFLFVIATPPIPRKRVRQHEALKPVAPSSHTSCIPVPPRRECWGAGSVTVSRRPVCARLTPQIPFRWCHRGVGQRCSWVGRERAGPGSRQGDRSAESRAIFLRARTVLQGVQPARAGGARRLDSGRRRIAQVIPP